MTNNPPFPMLSRFLAPPTCTDDTALRRAVEGKVVLVSGASYGIGRALALRLGAAGARLLLLARTIERLEEVADEIRSEGGQAEVFSVDLRDAEDIDRVTGAVLDKYPQVDIVVHNAGKSIKRSLHKSLDRPHDFERTMGVNYLGPVRMQLALLSGMIERGGGQIINVSSVSVRLPPAAHWAAYHSSKSAFDLWVGAAVPELAPHGICCTSVYMGLVHTRMSAPTESYAKMPGQTPEQAAASLCRAIVYRPRVVQPWWLGPARFLTVPIERLSEWVQCKVVSR
jgi:NAD(P)-dependent dehydrogenase (short-subunit alcohol dehydrogenase family)